VSVVVVGLFAIMALAESRHRAAAADRRLGVAGPALRWRAGRLGQQIDA